MRANDDTVGAGAMLNGMRAAQPTRREIVGSAAVLSLLAPLALAGCSLPSRIGEAFGGDTVWMLELSVQRLNGWLEEGQEQAPPFAHTVSITEGSAIEEPGLGSEDVVTFTVVSADADGAHLTTSEGLLITSAPDAEGQYPDTMTDGFTLPPNTPVVLMTNSMDAWVEYTLTISAP